MTSPRIHKRVHLMEAFPIERYEEDSFLLSSRVCGCGNVQTTNYNIRLTPSLDFSSRESASISLSVLALAARFVI